MSSDGDSNMKQIDLRVAPNKLIDLILTFTLGGGSWKA
jgi:hypothetical protein